MSQNNENVKKPTNLLQKIVVLAVVVALAAVASVGFVAQRNYKETVVSSDALTEVRHLSDYLPSLKGTKLDTPIFVYDSGVPGGSVLYLGGTHPYEPATSVSAYIMMENIKVEKGRVFIIPQANYSATTLGMLGNAYPPNFDIKTEWGKATYKIGDRCANPLDQWPDSFTYIHYPSGQSQAYQDMRNLNRCFPGRPDGVPTERVAYAMMELIRNEKIDISIDSHEASIMYPVVGTYVAHDRAMDIAMMAAMDLSANTFDMKIEQSPKALKGFSHRDWGDSSDTLAVLMETPEPFIDRIVGPMTRSLMLDGKDLFLSFAGARHLTFVPYTLDKGWPIATRVGRHLSGAAKVIEYMNQFYPDKEVIATWPSYNDLVEKDCGFFLHDPTKADPKLVFKI